MQVQIGPLAPATIVMGLDAVLRLPDPEAATALSERLVIFDQAERVAALAPSERLIIVRTFLDRHLWRHLIDPRTDLPFRSMTAWLSSGLVGCHGSAFEAKELSEKLADVRPLDLLGVRRGNLHFLAQLSTAVRNDPEVLEAARTMPQAKFEEKVEREHPTQHIVARKPMVFRLGRSDSRAVEDAIEWALEHDIAGSREEALVRMAEAALNEWKLDDEKATMPAAEVTA